MTSQMSPATREAFDTLWEDCTPGQRALREAWLPRREGNAQAEYDAELVRRFCAGEPLSMDGRRKARKLIAVGDRESGPTGSASA